jgi:hypothetical protein
LRMGYLRYLKVYALKILSLVLVYARRGIWLESRSIRSDTSCKA